MAGHNKWSKVKHRKGAVDAKRSKIWTKIIREITVAAKLGGDDPSSNPRLRKALEDARSNNISKDTISRALAKASGNQEIDNYEELIYEGYGPSGVALLVECLTDNRNRTYGDVRSAFNKNGGNLGASGSVSFGFKKKGQMVLEKSHPQNQKLNEDILLEIGLEHGLEDVANEDETLLVTCDFEKFFLLKEELDKNSFICASAEIVMVPDNTVPVNGENAKNLLKLIDILEELDDVQNVWSNEDISDDEI